MLLALRDPRLYLFTLLQHASLLSQTFQYFFPSILQTLGYGNIQTLLLTVPVWVLTFLASLVVTYTSGRFADRSIHIICLIMISVAGNIIVVSTLNTAVRFFALFLLPLGAVPAYQVSWFFFSRFSFLTLVYLLDTSLLVLRHMYLPKCLLDMRLY